MNFSSLLYIDLSHNSIKNLEIGLFRLVENLKELYIGWNPISNFDTLIKYPLPTTLQIFDLSGTNIQYDFLWNFLDKSNKDLFSLNLSSTYLTSIPSFSKFEGLKILDVSRNDIEFFPRDVFTGLSKLTELYSDNPKLCCSQLLPEVPKHCYTTEDEISSCENLLRANLYRAFLWVFSLSSIVGNAASFFSRLISHKKSSKTGKIVSILLYIIMVHL